MRSALNLLWYLVFATGSWFDDTPRLELAYPFKSSPLEIFDQINALKVGETVTISTEERLFLDEAWTIKSSNGKRVASPEFILKAMLFASGREDAASQEKYRQRFEELLRKARQEIKQDEAIRERGEALLKYLHSNLMKGGYDLEQSLFTEVFDSGKFNCVSSTALYSLLGTRLDLKLRAISIPSLGILPGHAAVDLMNGESIIQVEPTNPDGFDWGVKSKQPGVIIIGYVPDREKGHAIDELGIAACVYSNRGVALSKSDAGNAISAARCYLAALCLNPTDESAKDNLISVITNWGGELVKQEKFDDATRLLDLGCRLGPTPFALLRNREVAWATYLSDTVAKGRDEQLTSILDRARRSNPDDIQFNDACRWFIYHGENQIEKEGWKSGIAIAERGLKVIPKDKNRDLRDWRGGVFRRWSQSHLAKGEFDDSLEVLSLGLEIDPEEPALVGGVIYHLQEALDNIEKESGIDEMVKHYQVVEKRFSGMKEVAGCGLKHAQQSVYGLVEERKFLAAIDVAPKYATLAGTNENLAELSAIAYDGWGRQLAEEKQWDKALGKYSEGLKKFPDQGRLLQNGRATVDRWAGIAIDAKNWDEAIRIYRVGLKHFPESRGFDNNIRYCEQQKEK